MKKINIYGSPSSGKSTLAALLYAELKIKNISVELVREYAKELVYRGKDISNLPMNERLDILNHQIEREMMFIDQVDYLITDAPLLISTFYNNNPEALDLARRVRRKFLGNESHYFLERNHDFETAGRSHNEEQSDNISREMKDFLTSENVNFQILRGQARENLESILTIEGLIYS